MPQQISGQPELSLQQRAQVELERRKRMEGGEVSGYDAFKKKYKHNPSGFAMDCIDWGRKEGLSPYQMEALRELSEYRRYCIRGPHGLGKTALASIAILWFSLTRDDEQEDWKIPTTASAWRQLNKFLWPEIHKWSRRLKWHVIGRPAFDRRTELMSLSMKLSTGEAFAMASDDHTLLEGAHADTLLYLFDESKSIPDATWDAAEGAFSTGDCYWLAISTPGEPIGRFYDIQKRKPGYEDWKVRHVTKDEAIGAGRMDKKWSLQRKRQWGEDSAVYQNRVEGNFASSDEDSTIPLAAIERANERWLERKESTGFPIAEVLGVDVGRGGDPSVIASKGGNVITKIEEIDNDEIMGIAGIVSGRLRGNFDLRAMIDLIGLGAGVYDRCKEQEDIAARVMAFVASLKTDKTERNGERGFVDSRSAMWWIGREMLLNDELDLPPDDTLTGELTAPKYWDVSNGRIRVESKDDIRKRLGRSTNYADAVLQTLWEDSVGSWEEFEKLGTVENYVSPWR